MKKVFLFLFFCVFMLSAQDSFAQYKPAEEVASILQAELKAVKADQTATLSATSMNTSTKYAYLKALVHKLGETKNVSATVDAVHTNFTARMGENVARTTAVEAVHQEIIDLISE